MEVDTEAEAQRLVVAYGSLDYDGKEYRYTGPIDDDYTPWHEGDQMARVKGMFWLADRIKERVNGAK